MTNEPTPDNDIANTPSYKALKAVVIGLGILLVLGFAVVVATIGYRIANMGGDGPAEQPQPAAEAAAEQSFGILTLSRPEGTRLVGVSADGAMTVLHFRDDAGNDELVFLETATGKTIGRIEVPAR